MMLRLIDDVNKALESECYFSALTLALTFPDICGKAEYPLKKPSERYKDWYDEYIGKYAQCPSQQCRDMPMPYLSGEVIYSLRNSIIHQGTPDIDVDKIRDSYNKIDNFQLVFESKKPFDIYSDAASINTSTNNERVERVKSYRVNVRRLCLILCRTAGAYYETNRDKFDFFRYSIIDWDSEVKKMRSLGF